MRTYLLTDSANNILAESNSYDWILNQLIIYPKGIIGRFKSEFPVENWAKYMGK